ncbi:uncharacterized protein LDX57_003461 [Aspergillus melleus]|uniref:uncharacterized protein n=1 Tax=Aspergillus melleus TaxID=138277 RepID=UPI001E8E91CD|nr:uncharacterized protein LDX57_003461 [Aspergillus melleus]KAH8425714.1 hypothetical protein LDX57_003461 [Aspergillus melleus]
MPFRVDRAAAREEPIPFVFKLRKSWGEIKYAQRIMESDNFSFGDIDQVLSEDGALRHTPSKGQTDTTELQDAYDGDISETASLASYRSTESNPQSKQAQQLTHNVCHPWDVVDYHLYLCGIEKGTDIHSRRNGMYVYDGLDCRPVSYRELFDDEAFDPSNIGEDPKFLSWILPVSNGGSSFEGRSYVLGFEYRSRTLFVRQFHWLPGETDDIWCVWDEGFTMYRLSIPELIGVLDSVLSGTADVGRGILTCHALCMIPRTGDDPGLEIVITILLSQWVIDFAAVFSGMDPTACNQFTKTLTTYMEDCRLILQRASYRAWFASRDGHTMRDYNRKGAIDKYTNDLYTFSQSAESGSLKDKSWHAPSLDTCNMLRRRERSLRRERTEWKLEGLFMRPATALPVETPEQVLKKMLARIEPPGTPSPLQSPSESAHRDPSSGDSSGVQSPDVVAAEPSLIFEATDFHKIPLALLLERFLELVETYPGLDTPGHRRLFGRFLSEIGIDIEHTSSEDCSMAPVLESQDDRWILSSEADTFGSPRLQPSPLLDC